MGPVFAEPPRQVIGVVGNTRDGGLDQDPVPTMYIPIAQMPDKVTALNSRIAPLWWIVRTRVTAHAVTPPSATRSAKPLAACPSPLRTMDEIDVLDHLAPAFQYAAADRLRASALLMAAIGIYGLCLTRSSSAPRNSASGWRSERRPETFATWSSARECCSPQSVW